MKSSPLSSWKNGIISGFAFFLTVIFLSVGYAAYTTMSPVTSGQSLTATAWNTVIANIDDLNARWARSGSDLAFTGGKVGIGTATPIERLDLGGGNIKMGYETVTNDCVGTSVIACTASCPAGKYVTGGGCVVDNSVKYVYRTYPSTTGQWTCHSQGNLENAGSVLRAYAICVNIR